jgi:hypothetical protein
MLGGLILMVLISGFMTSGCDNGGGDDKDKVLFFPASWTPKEENQGKTKYGDYYRDDVSPGAQRFRLDFVNGSESSEMIYRENSDHEFHAKLYKYGEGPDEITIEITRVKGLPYEVGQRLLLCSMRYHSSEGYRFADCEIEGIKDHGWILVQ